MTGRLMLASLALVLTVEVADPTVLREAAGFLGVAGEDREDTKSLGHWNSSTFGKKSSARSPMSQKPMNCCKAINNRLHREA